MASGIIAWHEFDWQSFATLATGLSAVIAATLVGLRQTDIQHRQTKVQEDALRLELFEKRYLVFQKAEQFLREIVQEANDPKIETQHNFRVAIGESRFLFKPEVKEGLNEIWLKWSEFHVLKRTMNHTFETQGHYGAGNPEKESVALIWLLERMTSLPDLFQELKLGDIGRGLAE